MQLMKVLAALLLAVTWVSAVLHVELEGAGLLPEHTHVADFFHHHAETTHSGHEPPDHEHGFTFHDEIVARNGMSWLAAVLAFTALAPAAFSFLALFGLMGGALRFLAPVVVRTWDDFRPWSHAVSAWRFLRRCAADSLAPPVAA